MKGNPEYIVMVDGAPNGDDMQFISAVDVLNIGYRAEQATATRFKTLDEAYEVIRQYRTLYGEFRNLVAVNADAAWTKERRKEFLPHWKWEQCRHKSVGLLNV